MPEPTGVAKSSITLAAITDLPKTVCVTCPNAVWHITLANGQENLKAFCQVMHCLIDDPMVQCDGVEMIPTEKNVS